MHATVISIGDELLSGDCVDTNAAWLCRMLLEHGVQVDAVHQVGDDEDHIAEVLCEAAESTQCVIASGGLGPTPDDLTRAGLANAFDGGVLESDSNARDWIRHRLNVLGVEAKNVSDM